MRRLVSSLLSATLLAGLLPLQVLAAAPVLTLPAIPSPVDELVPLTFTATATDLEGDPLTFDLAAGTMGPVPPGASIDPVTGAFTWTPTESQGPGVYTFDITVSDGDLADAETVTVTVAEVNTAPVLVPVGPLAVAEGATDDIALAATDADIPAQPLTFSLGVGTPAWISLAGSTLHLAPAFEDASADVTVCVSDGTLDDCETVTVTVSNTNRAPAFDQNLGDRTSAEGAVISLDAGATDPDGDALTYEATDLPAGLSINPATGLISGTIGYAAAASSPYSVSITVRDGPTVDATDTFTWTVTQHEPGTGLRPEPGRPDQRRGRRHQPRRRGDRPRRRRPDLRGHGPPGRPLDQPGHRAHQRHDRLRRGRLEPVQREHHRPRRRPPSTRPTRSPGRSATRTGHRPSTRTWATGPAPRAPSSASTPGRPTPTATP